MPQKTSTQRVLRGTYTVAPDDPFLAGHFPGFPLVPGFLLVQYLIALVNEAEALDPGAQVVLEKARFRSPVLPGTPVVVEAAVRQDAGTLQVSAALTTASGPVADLRLGFGTTPAVGGPGGSGMTAAPSAAPSITPSAGPGPGIESVIPHRSPALFVDTVTHVQPGARIRTRGTAPACDVPALASPTGPYRVFPPGLLLEAWAQSAVALACWSRPNPRVTTGLVTLLAGVRKARVLAPVPLGAVLEHECVVVRDLGDTVITAGTCHADGIPVLEVEQLTLALRAADALVPATPAPSQSIHEGS